MSSPAHPVEPSFGSRMGPYELIARLAQGGMAELYLARSTGAGGFEKVVVLKRILPVYESDPDFVRMFWQKHDLQPRWTIRTWSTCETSVPTANDRF